MSETQIFSMESRTEFHGDSENHGPVACMSLFDPPEKIELSGGSPQGTEKKGPKIRFSIWNLEQNFTAIPKIMVSLPVCHYLTHQKRSNFLCGGYKIPNPESGILDSGIGNSP